MHFINRVMKWKREKKSNFSLTYITSTSSTTDASTYDFTSQSFGDAEKYRFIIVCAGGRAAATRTISSVTIGGVAASEVVSVGSNQNPTGIWIAAVPSGASGTVTVVFDNTMNSAGISIFRLVGGNPIATSTASDTTQTSNAFSATLVIPTGGVGIGHVNGTGSNAVRTWSWTNLTEVFDATIESFTSHTGARSTTAGSATRTATANGALAASPGVLVLAAWGA